MMDGNEDSQPMKVAGKQCPSNGCSYGMERVKHAGQRRVGDKTNRKDP